MTNHDGEGAGTTPSSAGSRAQHAIDSAKEELDQLRTKAADTASALYQEGRDLLARDELVKAKDQLSESVRKNPLAAVGIAFTAGLLLALLTRG